MIDNSSMDLSLSNLWRCWYRCRRDKKSSPEILVFQYDLETNLFKLQKELDNGTYRHGGYRVFTVQENKKRTISVTGVRDRVVHRLVYEFLVSLYDPTFIFDIWSCRKGKGLISGIKRTQKFLNSYPSGYVWRADITKFFDNVDHQTLFRSLERKVSHPKDKKLLKEIIASFSVGPNRERERERERESKNASPKK